MQRTARTENVLAWLTAQAARFRVQRDALLQPLAPA
jgi:hypothetical protein